MERWWWKADYIESCTCAHGCPCNFTALPTHGYCRGVGSWRVREGAFGDDVRLDGLCLGLILRWPGPIHRGGGRAVVFVDERGDGRQRDALARIGRGDAGAGGPFELFAGTYAEPAAVRIGRFEFAREGRTGRVVMEGAARVTYGPCRSDLDGSEADARLVLPAGFIFRDGRIVNTERCEVSAPGFETSYVDSNAFFSEVEYNVDPS